MNKWVERFQLLKESFNHDIVRLITHDLYNLEQEDYYREDKPIIKLKNNFGCSHTLFGYVTFKEEGVRIYSFPTFWFRFWKNHFNYNMPDVDEHMHPILHWPNRMYMNYRQIELHLYNIRRNMAKHYDISSDVQAVSMTKKVEKIKLNKELDNYEKHNYEYHFRRELEQHPLVKQFYIQ